jgi:hypothetical protein
MLVIRGGIRFTLNPEERWKDQSNSTYQRFMASIARSMLWYPAGWPRFTLSNFLFLNRISAYILFLVPYSVTRLLSIGGYTIPFQAVVFAFVCWFALGVVDALLLFNTFRILGPAFAVTGNGSGYNPGDLESFSTTETFERLTSDSKGPLKLNLTEDMIKEYRGVDASISSASSYQPSVTVSYPDRAASPQSSHRRATPEDMQQRISPVSVLNESIVVESAGSMVSTHPPVGLSASDHTRQESQSSISSLPVPPRRTPTPSRLAIDPPSRTSSRLSPIQRPFPTLSSLSPRNTPTSSPKRFAEQTRLSGASTVSSSSSASGDLDVPGWLARQNPDGSIPSGMRNQPMLSAVKPTFPPSVSSSDLSVTPAARLRPLLLASVERTGSMALAEQYNKLYPHSPNGSVKSTM